MSKIINAMLETAKDLKMDSITIKEIEVLNLSEIKLLQPSEIKKTVRLDMGAFSFGSGAARGLRHLQSRQLSEFLPRCTAAAP